MTEEEELEIAVWSLALYEIVRQVYVSCEERGELLECVRVRLSTFLLRSLARNRVLKEEVNSWSVCSFYTSPAIALSADLCPLFVLCQKLLESFSDEAEKFLGSSSPVQPTEPSGEEKPRSPPRRNRRQSAARLEASMSVLKTRCDVLAKEVSSGTSRTLLLWRGSSIREFAHTVKAFFCYLPLPCH